MQMTNLASIQLVLWNILKKYRVDPDDVFRKVGLNPALMHKAGKRYPVRKTDELWLEASRRIPDPCFGLLAAECWHPSYLGTLGYAMLASTSLRIALERLIRFHQVVSDIRFAKLEVDRGAGNLVFTLTDRDGDPALASLEDAVMALVVGILRMNFQEDIRLSAVTFRHGEPECSSMYHDLFMAPVLFGQPGTSLALPVDLAEKTLPCGNEEVAGVNEQLMSKYLASLDSGHLVKRVKSTIVQHLPSGAANLENVARQLYLSPRTLQRHLRREGTTFAAVLDETRQELARQYLKESGVDLTDVAFLLGFSQLSSFSRSFKRWTGCSPASYRQVA